MPDPNKNIITPEDMDNLLNRAFLEMDPHYPKNLELVERVSKSIMLTDNVSQSDSKKKFFKKKGFWIGFCITVLVGTIGILLSLDKNETRIEKNQPVDLILPEPASSTPISEGTNLQTQESQKEGKAASRDQKNPTPPAEPNNMMPVAMDTVTNTITVRSSTTMEDAASDSITLICQDSSSSTSKTKQKRSNTDIKRNKKKGKGKWVEHEIKIYPK